MKEGRDPAYDLQITVEKPVHRPEILSKDTSKNRLSQQSFRLLDVHLLLGCQHGRVEEPSSQELELLGRNLGPTSAHNAGSPAGTQLWYARHPADRSDRAAPL